MSRITMKNRVQDYTLSESFEHFIRKCKVKNLSEVSIKSYQQKTRQFFDFFGEDRKISEVNITAIEDFILWLRSRESCGDIAINSVLRAVRAWLYFCMDNEYLPRFKVQLIKCETPVKKTYSDSALLVLLRKPDKKNCAFVEFRTWALINFLVGTGVRVSTAVNVKISDINFQDGTILLRQVKNRRQQIIPLGKQLASVLEEYLTVRGGEPSDYLFCNEYGQQSTVKAQQTATRKYNLKRGIDTTSLHSFRHTFAKNWVLSGGDVFRLQKIMGHSDLSVTRQYVAMFGGDLQMNFEKFNPLDRLAQGHDSSKRIKVHR